MIFELNAIEQDGRIIVSNPCWEVIHDPARGGCIQSIRFFHGMNRNILTDPVSSIARHDQFGVWTKEEYRDSRDPAAELELISSDSEHVRIRTRAEMKGRSGEPSGITVESLYHYFPGHCKVERKYHFSGSLATLNRLSVVQVEAVPELDRWMARPSPVTNISNETAAAYSTSAGTPGPSQWGVFDSYEVPFKDWHIPLQLSLYRRDGEVVEIMTDSEYDNWLHAFSSAPDTVHYSFVRCGYDPLRHIMGMEPFFGVENGRSIPPSGDWHFNFYLNLPNNTENGPSRRWQRSWPVLRFRKGRRWATEDEVKEMADNGIQFIIHHHDSPSGRGLWPAGSFFWPDGVIDPYTEEERANMKEVIGWVHKYGMKIVPYFNPFELHPLCGEFSAHRYEWGRYCRGSFMENRTDGGLYGVACCMRSGYRDFLKRYVSEVIEKYGFDGCYFDGLAGNYCEHPGHDHGKVHMSTDEMFELTLFARKLVGPEGILVLHNTGAPCAGLENYCDSGIAAEDVCGFPNFDCTVPATGHWGEIYRYGNHISRGACVWSALGSGRPDQQKQLLKATTRAHLEGITFYGTPFFQDPSVSQEAYFRLSRQMKNLDFNHLQFFSACVDKPVRVSNPQVHTALYQTDREALLVLGNADSDGEAVTEFFLDLPHTVTVAENGEPLRDGNPIRIPGRDFALVRFTLKK